MWLRIWLDQLLFVLSSHLSNLFPFSPYLFNFLYFGIILLWMEYHEMENLDVIKDLFNHEYSFINGCIYESPLISFFYFNIIESTSLLNVFFSLIFLLLESPFYLNLFYLLEVPLISLNFLFPWNSFFSLNLHFTG